MPNKEIFNLSYNSNNPNVNRLIEETFKSITIDDIRVGYIDPVKGYVVNVTLCEANEYAQKNPATRFVFRDGDNNVRYLNINQVNQLTPDDIIPKKECEGVEEVVRCDVPPKIEILGGGGVGALANPVIGADGSLLAVDLIKGGYGYQYAPQVKVIDNCKIGSGAVATAQLGTIVETEETYENELEEYEICEPDDPGYEKIYGPNGEDLGTWDPEIYTNIDQNDIKLQIEDYQENLLKIKNPFWTTRKFKPSKIFSTQNKNYFQTYNVDYDAWNTFMNSYAVSPVPPSNVPGSDNAGALFVMQWDADFPYDGEYVFRGLCDNQAKLYLDNLLIADLRSFADAVTPIRKTVKKGIHNLRIDLLNVPLAETITETIVSVVENDAFFFKDGDEFYFKVTGSDNDSVDVKFSLDYNDDPYIAGYAIKKITIPKDNGSVVLERNEFESNGNKSKSAEFKTNKNYGPISFEGRDVSAPDPKLDGPKNSRNKINFFDAQGEDVNAFLLASTKKSSSTIVKTTQVSNTSSPITNATVFNTVDYIKKANRRLWRMFPDPGSGLPFLFQHGVLPFDPNSKEAKEQSFAGTHTIVWNNINFPADGNYRIRVAVDDNVTLYIGDTEIRKEGFVKGTSTALPDLDKDYYFTAGNYTIRAELEQIKGNTLKKQNPMGIAIDIKTSYVSKAIVSTKSWNENPMGVSLTIDAPEPPVPQQKPPIQEGRCPPNPIWSTRFPNSRERWYPVRYTRNNAWSNFMNRYAISPVKPLDTPGSDRSGINYRNSWDIDIPYSGYYGVKGTRDNTGRLLIDGKEISKLDGFRNNSPKLSKVYLTQGKHKIEVEVYNTPQGTSNVIDKKIFSTQDWAASLQKGVEVKKDNVLFFKDGGNYYLKVTGEDLVEVKFSLDYNDDPYIAGYAIKKIIIPGSNNGNVVLERNQFESNGNKVKSATFRANQNYGPIVFEGRDVAAPDPKLAGPQDNRDKINFFDAQGEDVNAFLLASTKQSSAFTKSFQEVSSFRTSINQVSYSGPVLFNHNDNRWSSFMNKYSVSPKVFDNISDFDPRINGNFTLLWKNVNFPEDGQYDIQFVADNVASLFIGGRKIFDADGFNTNPTIKNTFINKGNYDVKIELTNEEEPKPSTKFIKNPMGAGLYISKRIDVGDLNQKTWYDNPIGISAVLIPPPCPKKVSGRGVISKINILDPGNGYSAPSTQSSEGYPVTLQLTEVIVTNPGINYNCGVDQIKIVPDLGTKLSYTCDTFGRINQVSVDSGGFGFTEYPTIYMDTETGVNFSAIPVFSVVRDPVAIGISTEKLIQVTDLVGLKQTGYVNGRAYYGAVYYDNNVRYAGYYKTIGTPIRVYDTLQESIIGEVTTPPSAIERFGTDITSNDPNLDIPGTPQNTTGP